MIMEKALAHDIDLKKEKVEELPEYHMQRASKMRAAFYAENKAHSWWIEHPSLRRELLVVSSQDRGRLIKECRKGIKNVEKAWHFLSGENQAFTEDALYHVAAVLEPNYNKQGYRRDRVSLQLASFIPPNPIKVPELMRQALGETRDGSMHVIERAATLHLRIAGTQPFLEGNKRLARLYQDKILYDAHLPPAIIPAGEREIYLDLLERGLVALRDGKREGRKEFFDYIGGKVNSLLDEHIGDLKI